MLQNPFTPAAMATEPTAFFGRDDELNILARAIQQGSVAIQGPVGIGKSSLLSRTLMHMDGFMSDEKCVCKIAVGHSDIVTVDDAARLVLEGLVDVDDAQKKVSIGLPNIAQYEATEVYRFFQTGRHLAALTRIIEDRAFKELLDEKRQIIFAIDEADKCAPALARLVRTVSTKTQLQGINNIRFILAGVSPFYTEMIHEDQGVSRFIYKLINLGPLLPGESRLLLDTKFGALARSARTAGLGLKIDPTVIERIDKLSGGHPHLLQLLGSHVIEHEYLDPDGVIDARDLVDSLRGICYESRGPVYDSLIHRMRDEGVFGSFTTMVELAGGKFPGIVSRRQLLQRRAVDPSHIQWLLERNVLSQESEDEYRIVDEFLRIRVILDIEGQSINEIEQAIVTDRDAIDFGELDLE